MHLSLPHPLAKPIYIGQLGLVDDRRRQVGSRLPPRRRRGCRRRARRQGGPLPRRKHCTHLRRRRRCYLPLVRRLMNLPSPPGLGRRLCSFGQLRPKEHHNVRLTKMHAMTAKIQKICYLRLRTRPRTGTLFSGSIIPCYCYPRFHAFVRALLP